jgi:tetratricopeptide (TPR) repeat protein
MLLPLFVTSISLLDRDPASAADQFRMVAELSRKHHMPEVEGHALGFQAVAIARLGRFDEADRKIDEALEAAPRSGSPVKVADVHIAVSMAYYAMGEIERGLTHARIGAEMAHKANAIECACSGYYSIGLGELERHEMNAAIGEFRKSLRLADFVGWEGMINLIRGGVAIAEFESGETRAVEDLEAALRNAKSVNDTLGAADLSGQLAAALLKLDRPADAEQMISAAADHFRALGMLPYLSRALELQARIEERLGRVDDAERSRAEAESLRRSFRATPRGAAA